ncbi:uncharacterized protein K460DRAFT_83420 [Cucurbitaria berberidis CBS 394.84]|uniref:Uncharacterized protein n=1 Tax=Cucurbitaria berberidis CBS 394.84 TaxID=1168544 RepID=A0A9P4LC33_9PLEO|nr:uncharacterized protein K460DRAFT_83420 [Cucurbitaria berberidis CBS 394.84]KAF1848962.1 hypothetical protein K460DRAFT_83420 [Cucurbitaria berberidis CBS 394.84]
MASESLMNAAGRTSSHPFSDLRAASYAHRRLKKYPEQISRKRGHRGEDYRPTKYWTSLFQREESKHHTQNRPWEELWGAESDFKDDLKFMDEVVAYQRFGKYAEIFEGRAGVEMDGWMMSGEDFGAWGRKRIGEMRSVKEDRIRKAQCTRTTTTVPASRKDDEEHANSTIVSTSPIPNTTLPITPLDIHAHNLLKEILTPNEYFLRRRRFMKPPIPRISGFQWFGVYEWQWHRNQSGCWELGYADSCGGCSFPCTCCCVGNGSMYWPCSCAEFAKDEKGPEEVHTCSLIEWVKGPLWAVLMHDEHERRMVEIIEASEGEESKHSEAWELMSDAASEGWSIVSVESGFEILDI